ncbi:MAG: gliding-motility protein MglA, partial [Meiothermus sp.]|nr:gliding-motility protein MglA [Meiothermus sp.]
MSTINFAAREINFKIVYYGPGMSGKTTNLRWVFQQVPQNRKGEMVSLATEDERTLF